MTRFAADIIYRWRYALSCALLLGAVASIPSANVTDIDNDITSWFSRDDQVYRDYERFREEFGGTRSLIVALKAESAARLFSEDTLRFIEAVSSDIERVETVQRVNSLATATIVEATEDGGLDVRPLLDRLGDVTPDEIRRRALRDDLIRGDLVSDDGAVTAVVVGFDEDRIDEVRAGVIQQIHDIVDPRLPEGVRAYYNGSLEISETYNRVTVDNQVKFTPPIAVLTVLALFFTFRSWRKTLLSVIAILVSVLWTLGLYSLMGFSFNVLTSMIVPLIIVLAIADDVHIMQHWDEERRKGDAEYAFKATVRHLLPPLLGASTTTALGMMSLATSDVVAVRSFGIGAAVGIMVDFVISIILMPTLLSLVKPETFEAPHEKYLLGPLLRIARISCRYPWRVVAASAALGITAAFGILQLRVDTNHINFFGQGHPLRESAAVIDSSLSGVYSFEIMLEGPPESLKTPDALMRMDRLQNELRTFPHVRKVTSVADYVKRINKELNDGRDEANVIPADANTIAQELFVFALGGEGRHELERVVASDYSRAQIAVKLQSMSSELVLDEVERAERLARDAFDGTGITVLTTGSGRLFSTLDRYLVDSQVSSFGTAFVTVFGVIFVVFRSLRFGLLAIVPNLLPVVAVLGAMGYLDISLNIATVMVASVALGVVDDDTIHFINRYRVETGRGATTDEAIQIATAHEGRASLTTAIVNSCGYGVLLLSEYKPTAWFGGLLALTMAVAFLAEVFILPALIKLLPRVFGHERTRNERTRNEERGRLTGVGGALLLAAGLFPAAAAAQGVDGHVSLFADYFPRREHTAELRSRVFAEQVFDPTPRLLITASGYAEALLSRRQAESPPFDPGFEGDAILRAQDVTVDYTRERFAVLAGYGRVVWGRLDELQPTDVVNPLDTSRFFFEGRSEARLPVALVRGRLFFPRDTTLEAIYVPFFRRGRFDELDEPTSPFNLEAELTRDTAVCLAIGCPTLPLPVDRRAPAAAWRNAQGGIRFSNTLGRVDWAVSAYRGFEPFGFSARPPAPLAPGGEPIGVGFDPLPPAALALVHPRFTMVGADFETVSGKWGVRGELAAFVDDNFQGASGVVEGESIDAGLGVDRRAGDYTLSGTLLVHRETHAAGRRTDVTLIASGDRTFARERYRLRVFAVANPSEGSGFVRAIGIATLGDNLALESSIGWFVGDGRDVIGRFGDRDFGYVRVKAYF
jgi:predicted RND superfamily exporter protein